MTDKKQEPCPCCGSPDVRWLTQWEALDYCTKHLQVTPTQEKKFQEGAP